MLGIDRVGHREKHMSAYVSKVLFSFPIFFEMKSHRTHEYVAAFNLYSYILTQHTSAHVDMLGDAVDRVGHREKHMSNYVNTRQHT